MKDHLQQLLETCIEIGSEEDLKAIALVLEGIQKKISKQNNTFINDLFHMERTVDLDQKTCEITIPLTPLVNNNLDIIHGGITATILDTAMGTVANSILPEGYAAVTSQLNIHYMAPGIGDTLRCTADIIHQGSKTFVISGQAYRSDGKKIAYATGTFFIIQK